MLAGGRAAAFVLLAVGAAAGCQALSGTGTIGVDLDASLSPPGSLLVTSAGTGIPQIFIRHFEPVSVVHNVQVEVAIRFDQPCSAKILTVGVTALPADYEVGYEIGAP